jgi:hypothetical protein
VQKEPTCPTLLRHRRVFPSPSPFLQVFKRHGAVTIDTPVMELKVPAAAWRPPGQASHAQIDWLLLLARSCL